jgi:hypothetical protein
MEGKENGIKTKSISELILNEKTPERELKVEHYTIPYYQRGYRWEKRHIEYLLKDLDTFITEKITSSDYCLQPIVVTPQNDRENKIEWEVIDGQQRLITLYLIFQYINKHKFQLDFKQRQKSTDFVKQLNENTYSDDNPDFHYMSDAYKTIKEFFDEKLKSDITYFDTFYVAMKKVKVIWYEIGSLDNKLSEDEKIDIFNRLNIGKIPLTDAELIRALLLAKIKTGLTERESILRQAEISEEWNRIEHELRNEEFWYFLNSKPQKSDASHIEFIFNLMAGSEANDYTTYLWFENQIMLNNRSAKDLWDNAKQLFGQLKSWYNKRTLYHYVGYLLIENEKKYSIQNIKVKQDQFQTKSEFEIWLKDCVKEEIQSIDLREVSYDEQKNNIKKILLLFNVLSLGELPDIPQNRFPFHSYKSVENDGGWSIEHIHAQNSKELKDLEQIKVWLEKTLSVLKNIKSVEKTLKDENEIEQKKSIDIQPYCDKINALLKQKGNLEIEEFNKLKRDLSWVFDSHSVHELSNLALLGRKENSALQNDLFPVKREMIIDLEKQGRFIPYCTKTVFMKAYSNADNQPFYWSEVDKEAYFNEINRVINLIKN